MSKLILSTSIKKGFCCSIHLGIGKAYYVTYVTHISIRD